MNRRRALMNLLNATQQLAACVAERKRGNGGPFIDRREAEILEVIRASNDRLERDATCHVRKRRLYATGTGEFLSGPSSHRRDKAMTAKTAKKTAAKKPAAEGYKGHRAGSLKEKLHKIFDATGGDEKGYAQARKLDVADSTITTSFSQFRVASGKGRKVAKAKAKAKKPAKKAA